MIDLKTETEIQKEIIDYLKSIGFDVYRMNSGRKGGITLHTPGTPDLMAQRNGLTIWIEVKQPGKKPTKIQLKRHKEITENGFIVIVATSVEETQKHLKHLDIK